MTLARPAKISYCYCPLEPSVSASYLDYIDHLCGNSTVTELDVRGTQIGDTRNLANVKVLHIDNKTKIAGLPKVERLFVWCSDSDGLPANLPEARELYVHTLCLDLFLQTYPQRSVLGFKQESATDPWAHKTSSYSESSCSNIVTCLGTVNICKLFDLVNKDNTPTETDTQPQVKQTTAPTLTVDMLRGLTREQIYALPFDLTRENLQVIHNAKVEEIAVSIIERARKSFIDAALGGWIWSQWEYQYEFDSGRWMAEVMVKIPELDPSFTVRQKDGYSSHRITIELAN